MENYNRKLIMALHSFFWYEDLLDQVSNQEEGTDEFVYFDSNGNKTKYKRGCFARPKYREDCIICKLVDDLRNKKTDSKYYRKIDANQLFNKDEYTETFDDRYSMLWQILVAMFGNYGTSPRTGWIEDRTACADFLETVIKAEELEYSGKL